MLKFVYNLFITFIMLYICRVQEIVQSSLQRSNDIKTNIMKNKKHDWTNEDLINTLDLYAVVNGLTTLGEVDESETKLSQYLNTI